MLENIEDPIAERERQIAEQMIRGQLKQGKSITIFKSFADKIGKDPISFLENLIVDMKANSQDETNLLKVIEEFLKNDTREWFIDNRY